MDGTVRKDVKIIIVFNLTRFVLLTVLVSVAKRFFDLKFLDVVEFLLSKYWMYLCNP